VKARQHGHHGHEQRQGDQGRHLGDHGVAQQQADVGQRHAALGRLAQHADQHHGEHHGQQHHQRPDKATPEFSAERGIE